MGTGTRDSREWTLLTGHGHVLVEIARDPGARISDISAACQITQRTVQAIVADLEAAGYIVRTRSGRRTRYTIDPDRPFRHPAQAGHHVGPFLALLTAGSRNALPRTSASGRERPAGLTQAAFPGLPDSPLDASRRSAAVRPPASAP